MNLTIKSIPSQSQLQQPSVNGVKLTVNPTQDQTSAQKFNPTFPAQGANESMISAPAKAVGNIPSSAYNFGKNLINLFNPVNIANTVGQDISGFGQAAQDFGGGTKGVDTAVTTFAKNLPSAAYQTIVPEFFRHIITYATETNPVRKEQARQQALDTIVNDPVGQIAPVLLAARGLAESVGKGAEFDAAAAKVTEPIKSAVAAPFKLATKAGEQALGISTGAGIKSIQAAVKGSPEFTAAMRGQVTPEDVVNKAQDAYQQIVDQRRQTYLNNFKNLDEYKKSADISSLDSLVKKQLDNFGVKANPDGTLDFSRSAIANSGPARGDIQGVYDTLQEWGKQPGDRTVQGLDTLKKQLGDFYSQSSQARAFVQSIVSHVKGILNTNFPKYEEMTQDYANASQSLKEIQQATSLGGKANYDTAFTKLTRALKSDNGFRLDMLRRIHDQTGVNLEDYIAGTNLSRFTPKGVGSLVDAGAAYALIRGIFTPQEIPVLLSTSPRIVGEFVRALGITSRAAGKVIDAVNTLRSPEGKSYIFSVKDNK